MGMNTARELKKAEPLKVLRRSRTPRACGAWVGGEGVYGACGSTVINVVNIGASRKLQRLNQSQGLTLASIAHLKVRGIYGVQATVSILKYNIFPQLSIGFCFHFGPRTTSSLLVRPLAICSLPTFASETSLCSDL